MPDVPGWWEALLLALAAYRTWRLTAEDDLLDRPRRWVLRLGSEWKREGDPIPPDYRAAWAEFLRCPWCAGAWIAALWWLGWLLAGDWATMIATPFALSSAVALIRENLDSA